MEIPEKLAVLARIAAALNGRRAVWAVGGSLLLYCKGKAPDFHDIDLVAAEADAEAVRDALLALGALHPPRPKDPMYGTKHFWEFSVDGVEVDVMAGLSIWSGGAEHRFPLKKEDIREFTEVNGVPVPLDSLAAWRTYYALMGRREKAAMIDGG